MSDLPNKFIEKLTEQIENIVNVWTLCKNLYSVDAQLPS